MLSIQETFKQFQKDEAQDCTITFPILPVYKRLTLSRRVTYYRVVENINMLTLKYVCNTKKTSESEMIQDTKILKICFLFIKYDGSWINYCVETLIKSFSLSRVKTFCLCKVLHGKSNQLNVRS